MKIQLQRCVGEFCTGTLQKCENLVAQNWLALSRQNMVTMHFINNIADVIYGNTAHMDYAKIRLIEKNSDLLLIVTAQWNVWVLYDCVNLLQYISFCQFAYSENAKMSYIVNTM